MRILVVCNVILQVWVRRGVMRRIVFLEMGYGVGGGEIDEVFR
jgi:hypothetical protein